jgi:hypothetical protein
VSKVTTNHVRLNLPEQVLRETELPYDGVRDPGAVVVAIQGVDVAASIVTLATLKQYAPRLAASLRQWRLRQPRQPAGLPTTLTVRGPGLELSIDLPPNVSTQHLLTQLAPLLDPSPSHSPSVAE